MNNNAAVDVPSSAQDAPLAGSTRWIQLALGLLCMMAISSPQYVWTLFTKPLMGKLGVTLAELQVTFSILIVLQTFLSPVQGFLIERFGPKRLLSIGAIVTGASWVIAASATSLTDLYLSYACSAASARASSISALSA